MADMSSTRRGILGAIAVAPAALAAMPASATSRIAEDPVWRKLVADFRTKYAVWLTTIDLQDEAQGAYYNACSSLPQEPTQPSSGLGDVLEMTLREIRAIGKTPEQKAAWADYERDHAAWKAQRDALSAQVVGPAEADCDRAYAVRSDALKALTSHRVINLCDLGEKIEIIAEDCDGSDIPQEHLANVLADVRHLARKA